MPINIERVKQMREQMGSDQSQYVQVDMWRPPEGRSVIRMLPSVSSTEEVPFKTVGYHSISKRSHICPRVTSDSECPFCKFVDTLFQSKAQADLDLAKALRVQRKAAWWIIVRGQDEKSPKVWVSSPKISRQLLDHLAASEYGDYTDLTEGRDFNIDAVIPATDSPIQYTLTAKGSPSPLFTSKEDMKEVLLKIKESPISEVFTCMAYEKLAGILDSVHGKGAAPKQEKVEHPVEVEPKHQESTPADTTTQPNPRCYSEFDSKDVECSRCKITKECSAARTEKEKPKKEPVGASEPVKTDPTPKAKVEEQDVDDLLADIRGKKKE